MTRSLLWVMGLVIVTVAMWPTLRVPVQGDDFQSLFNIAPHYDGSLVGQMFSGARFAVRIFRDGTTTHFYPVGLALDHGLKRMMLRAPSFHMTASGVHHAAMFLTTIGTFVSSTLLVSRLRRRNDSTFGTSIVAVPVAIGFAVSMQVTTPWSTYDPVVVHPVFGSLATFVGVSYLAVLVRVVRRNNSRRSTIACAVLGIVGVLLYEGFYAFLGIAVLMIIYRAVSVRHAERAWRLDAHSVAAVTPALLIVLVTRVYGLINSVSTYQGTEIGLSRESLAALSTSMRTTSPGGTWGRSISSLPPTPSGLSASWVWAGAAVVAIAVTWAAVARYLDTHSMSADTATEALEVGSAAETGRCESVLPIVGMLVLCPAMFALSVQWRTYLSIPGNTYMDAMSGYWAWSMLVGLGLLWAVAHRRGALAALVVGGALVWSAVQTDFNIRAVQAEVASPSPFGSDLVRILDAGTPLDESGRCHLVELAGMIDNRRARQSLNELYRDRHGQVFCTLPP